MLKKTKVKRAVAVRQRVLRLWGLHGPHQRFCARVTRSHCAAHVTQAVGAVMWFDDHVSGSRAVLAGSTDAVAAARRVVVAKLEEAAFPRRGAMPPAAPVMHANAWGVPDAWLHDASALVGGAWSLMRFCQRARKESGCSLDAISTMYSIGYGHARRCGEPPVPWRRAGCRVCSP